MTRLMMLKPDPEPYGHDVTMIIAAAFSHGDCIITRDDARAAWERYSECFCATWVILPVQSVDVWACIQTEFIEVPTKPIPPDGIWATEGEQPDD